MKTARYVGVSGVGSPEQQAHITANFNAHGLRRCGRTALLGVKATTRIQVDEIPARRGDDWYPVGDRLRDVLQKSDDTINVLQLYADEWTNLSERTLPLMENSLERSHAWLDGLQYDMLPWFDHDVSLEIIERYAEAVDGPVILQCYGDIMRSKTPHVVMERLKRVEEFVTHVLFDASEGRGELMEADALSVWIESLQGSSMGILPVIAGGLHAEAVHQVLPVIARRFDDISWDAESSLHTDDILDNAKVDRYLQASAAVLHNSK